MNTGFTMAGVIEVIDASGKAHDVAVKYEPEIHALVGVLPPDFVHEAPTPDPSTLPSPTPPKSRRNRGI